MRALLLFPDYIRWHYGRALQSIFEINANFMWFLWHFFSVGLMLSTFFAPWQRIQEEHVHGLDIGNYFSTTIINSVMRLVGIVIRSVFISIGCLAIVLTSVAGILFFVVWLALPLVIIVSFILGFIFLFRAS
jgi:hypothetical protein